MRRRVFRWALATVQLLALAAAAADFQGHARLWLGPGLDTNTRREFVSPDIRPQLDGFLFGLGQLEGLLRLGDRVQLLGSYDVSGRKFLFLPSQDMVLQSAQLEASVEFLKYFAVSLEGHARDRRGAERDYTDLVGGIALSFFPDPSVEVRANLSAHRFLFYPRFAYSHWGPDGGFSARYRIDRHHALSVFGSFNPRTYNAHARLAPTAESPEDTDAGYARADAVFGGGVSYSYRGRFSFSFSYSYFDQTSNSFGESLKRHRLSATGGFLLPWQLTVLATVTFQPSVFPDGVYLSPGLSLAEDDETMSSVTVKVVRPLNDWLEVDARYAGYVGLYPQNDFLYSRHVVSVGLAASF